MKLSYKNRIRQLEKRIYNSDQAGMQSISENSFSIANSNSLKLSDLNDRIMAHYKSNVSANTLRSYQSSFNNFLRIVGDKMVCQINKADLEEFKIIRSNEVNLNSVNIDVRNLKAIFNKMVEFELIEYSKFIGVKPFKIQNKKILSIDTADLVKILSTADGQMKQIIRFTLLTASRISEVLSLKIKDIDFDNGIINIFQRKSNSFKSIPLTKKLSELISEIIYSDHCESDNSMKYLFHKKISNDQYLKLRTDTISKKFKKILRELNLSEDFKFHSLRHSAITELIHNNVPLNIVKEIAGHQSITTTMLYSHVNSSDLKNAVNLLNF